MDIGALQATLRRAAADLLEIADHAAIALSDGPDAKTHVLVDWENVQPDENDCRQLVPEATDVWLFHGPNQRNVALRYASFGERATEVRIARTGKNALDFHLSFYIGYIASRHPQARFVVLSNDTGYGPMLDHAKELGFAVSQNGFARQKKLRPPAKKAAAKRASPVASAAPAAAEKAAAKKTAARKTVAKKAVSRQAAREEDVQKQAASKQVALKQTAPTQVASKQIVPKEVAAQHVTAKQTAAKRTAVKRPAAKKTATAVAGSAEHAASPRRAAKRVAAKAAPKSSARHSVGAEDRGSTKQVAPQPASVPPASPVASQAASAAPRAGSKTFEQILTLLRKSPVPNRPAKATRLRAFIASRVGGVDAAITADAMLDRLVLEGEATIDAKGSVSYRT